MGQTITPAEQLELIPGENPARSRRMIPIGEVVSLSSSMTQQQIAEFYGCSRQRISQILQKYSPHERRRSAPPPLNPNPSEVHRFWKRVKFGDGCWEWDNPSDHGYGRLRYRGGPGDVGAHRYSFMLHYGPIPRGMVVCHKCDNRRCVRPDHLYAGSYRDNAHDVADAKRKAA